MSIDGKHSEAGSDTESEPDGSPGSEQGGCPEHRRNGCDECERCTNRGAFCSAWATRGCDLCGSPVCADCQAGRYPSVTDESGHVVSNRCCGCGAVGCSECLRYCGTCARDGVDDESVCAECCGLARVHCGVAGHGGYACERHAHDGCLQCTLDALPGDGHAA